MPSFNQPSFRAAQSDLAISVSPLGLIELSDEEFEVHGPRLNRYASNWAFYLGHHWGYAREAGEMNITFNYTRAFSDYITSFAFGRGVHFKTPKATEAIIPPILHRVWEVDNDKRKVLWRMGQVGGVTGDCFVKVAYEDPFPDPSGRVHPGRLRIIPLNSAFCFPEWHPHDRDRMVRFKLKYRFWGCHDTETEALTKEGWKRYDEVTEDDYLLSMNADNELVWEKVQSVSIKPYTGKMHAWKAQGFNALTTPNHRWVADVPRGNKNNYRYERQIVMSGMRPGRANLVLGGGAPLSFPSQAKYADELVELVGWYVTEGWDHTNQTGAESIYLAQKRPEGLDRIRRLASWWRAEGATFSEYAPKKDGVVTFYLGKGVKDALWGVAKGKTLTPEFLSSLTFSQAELLYNTLMLADGYREREVWTQTDQGRVDGFQMLAAMLGKRTAGTSCGEKVQVYQRQHVSTRYLDEELVDYDGLVWCPTVRTGTFVARRQGSVFLTGNTAPDGTRQVFSYTEILTDDIIEEYINDEMIDQRPNPIGQIPIHHIANIPVEGSPWGLSDVQDLIPLNREYNEKATDISDIINYHAAPVTVITGAKASNLERGPQKVWGGLPKDANVFNLEMGAGLAGPLAFLELLKQSMHEMTGVPAGALGEKQPISNTSGVALAIEYQPLMNKTHVKHMQYGAGLEKINELALLTLVTKEPHLFMWNPTEESDLKPGQYPQLDPADPITYRTETDFPPPLPTDTLIKLNEIQARMGLGLESKRGALREMGEEFPDEKMAEIFEELREDAIEQGALNLLNSEIAMMTMAMTGMIPGEDGPMPAPPPPGEGGEGGVQSAGGPGVTSAGSGGGASGPLPGISTSADPSNLLNSLATLAHGTKLAQRRNPTRDGDS